MKREEYTRRKETRYIYTHTHAHAHARNTKDTRENETEESSRRCEFARSVVTL